MFWGVGFRAKGLIRQKIYGLEFNRVFLGLVARVLCLYTM